MYADGAQLLLRYAYARRHVLEAPPHPLPLVIPTCYVACLCCIIARVLFTHRLAYVCINKCKRLSNRFICDTYFNMYQHWITNMLHVFGAMASAEPTAQPHIRIAPLKEQRLQTLVLGGDGRQVRS